MTLAACDVAQTAGGEDGAVGRSERRDSHRQWHKPCKHSQDSCAECLQNEMELSI